MKILIPTAKEMNTNSEKYFYEDLSFKTENILNELIKYDIKDLMKIYNIKENQAKKERQRIEDLYNKKSFLYKALYLFDGLMYRNIRRENLIEKEIEYLNANVFITSSFYGIIGVHEKIAEHRLDFLQKLEVNNLPLKKYWQKEFDNFVINEDFIISLLSSEFEEVFSKNIRDKFIKVVFMEEKLGIRKIHSTISKKARGKFLSELVKYNLNNIEEIKKLNFDGYVFNEELSNEKKLTFVANRGE